MSREFDKELKEYIIMKMDEYKWRDGWANHLFRNMSKLDKVAIEIRKDVLTDLDKSIEDSINNNEIIKELKEKYGDK